MIKIFTAGVTNEQEHKKTELENMIKKKKMYCLFPTPILCNKTDSDSICSHVAVQFGTCLIRVVPWLNRCSKIRVWHVCAGGTLSWNHGMVQVGGDLEDLLIPTPPCHGQGLSKAYLIKI